MTVPSDIKKKLIIAVSILGLILALSLYKILKPYELKPYKKGIEELAADIFSKSAQKKFSGTISEIKTISGPQSDSFLNDTIIPELKLQLLRQDSPYTLIINPVEYEEWIRALRSGMQNRGVPDSVIADIIIQKTRKAKKAPDYRTELSWTWIDKSNGYIQLIFKISAIDFIESKTVITHPAFEKRYFAYRNFFTILAWISGVFFLFISGILIWSEISFKKLASKYSQSIPALKEKVTEYINAGQFVAAINEIEKYRKYLPEDSDLIALKNKILVTTKGNPSRGEDAYNRLRFIKGKLENRDVNQEDLKELYKISEFLEVEGLGAIIGRIEGLLKSKEIAYRINSAKQKAKALIENGHPDEAKKELEKIQEDPVLSEYSGFISNFPEDGKKLALPSPESINSELQQAENAIRDSIREMEEAKILLNSGKISEAEELLKKAISKNKNLKEPNDILSKLQNSKKERKFCLVPEKIGKKLFIFKKDVIEIFRKEFKEPDIEISSKTVSRNAHLKIAVINNKVIAEDQNSKAGTKIGGYHLKNGDKIEINDGDILDFNGGYSMTVHIYRGDLKASSATVVAGETSVGLNLNSKETKNISSVFFEGSDDRNFIMLFESAPVSFKNIGIIYEPLNPDSFIKLIDDVVFVLTPSGAQILYSGARIEYKGIAYKIQ